MFKLKKLINMDSLCRACLSSDKTLKLFDGLSIFNYKLLTSLTVEINDGLPQNFCSDCLNIIQAFVSYREQCIATENTLKTKLSNKDELDVQFEPPKSSSNIKFKEELSDTASNFDVNLEFDDDFEPDLKTEENGTCIDKNESTTITKPKREIPKRLSAKTSECEKDKIKKVNYYYYSNSNVSKLKIFNCGLCKEVFKKREALIDHLNNHKSNLVCLICKKDDFISWQALIAHRFNHIDNDEKYCHMCATKFSLELTCHHHYLYVHSANGRKHFKEFKCYKCLNIFKSYLQLEKHVRSVHRDKPFICDHCGKVSNSKTALIIHMSIHSTDKQFKCTLCDERFKLRQVLQNHMLRAHSEKKIRCKFCSRYFNTEENLNTHKCKSQTLCVCQVCGKSMMKKQLQRHMKSHSDKFFECPLCPTKVKTKGAFKSHTDKHAGTPAYQCEYCDRRFYSLSAVTKHRRIHTGEKPYVCVECGKAFTCGNNMKVHMKVHGLLLVKKRCPQEELTD